MHHAMASKQAEREQKETVIISSINISVEKCFLSVFLLFGFLCDYLLLMGSLLEPSLVEQL